ncbi:MAG TPA: DNA gyrase inhibitor YacG [Polyangiaceae bacterium]|nr:DNA gyrase inhibitor YacG [Polyangiaceae bacterium]
MDSCPICGRPAEPRTQNKAFPFCSPRCRQVDLGCWLDEKYRIAVDDGGALGGGPRQSNMADGVHPDEHEADTDGLAAGSPRTAEPR